MSRTGVEAKPPWRVVPLAVRRAVGQALGSGMRRAVRVWGGYTPSMTYRLRLADGSRAFAKVVGPPPHDFGQRAFGPEERVYRELPPLISPWMPAYYGSVELDGWRALLLEDLGPKSAPPWTQALVRAVTQAYGEFHRATLGVPLPDWLPGLEQVMAADRLWSQAEEEGPEVLRPVAGLAGDEAEGAFHWLGAAAPALAGASTGIRGLEPLHALLHRDTRSDNLRWVGGRLRLFDWTWAGCGPPEYDLAEFAQSVAVEGGPAPERVVAWYAERTPVRPAVLDAAVTSLAAFFANRAPGPFVPEMPRLRRFQRQQLVVTLDWAARRLHLPEPAWLQRVAVD